MTRVYRTDAATASRKAASLLQREQDKKLKQQQLAQQRLVDEHAHNGAPASMAPSPLAPPPSLGNDSEKQRQKEEEEEQRRMKEQEEAARRQKEADETKRKAREAAEAKRKAQEEEATRRAQEQEATRKTEEEAVKRRQQQEEDERRAAKEKAELAEKQRREEEERVAKQAQEQQATTNKSTNDDVIGRCIAMFDFEALKPSHLSFKKDDIIEITSKNPRFVLFLFYFLQQAQVFFKKTIKIVLGGVVKLVINLENSLQTILDLMNQLLKSIFLYIF